MVFETTYEVPDRRPPSGYHWCRVGLRVHNPDEIELDQDIINNTQYKPAVDKADAQQTSSSPVVDKADLDQASSKTVANEAEPQKNEALTRLAQSELEACEPDDYYDEAQEEEDDLGYYPDGVKRTLTDEQIAIFRHTERQMIQRRAERELNNDRVTKPSAQEAAYFLDDEEVKPLSKAKPQSGEQPPVAATKKPASKGVGKAGPAAPNAKKPGREEVPYEQRNKRKWEQYIDHTDPVHGSMTHRRIARERDNKVTHHIELDYD